MTNYVKTTNFTAKDTLPESDPGKLIKGYDFDVEFSAVASAIQSKADLSSPNFLGNPTAPTATAGANTTQIATTAFVNTAITAERSETATLTNKTLTSPTISGGTVSNITDLAVADGGTGASTATDARTNLDVPSNTGSGASGTWGISVTGNAGTATKLQTARTINGVSFDGSSNVTVTTAGSGINVSGATVSHADTSTAASSSNTGNLFVQNIQVDGFGHITSITSADVIEQTIPAPTTTQVLTATAGASAGAIGTYAFAINISLTSVPFGSTIAGSSLKPAAMGLVDNPDAAAGYNTGTLSGTWRAMGHGSSFAYGSTTHNAVTLWLRVS